jgi:hypothetical protein
MLVDIRKPFSNLGKIQKRMPCLWGERFENFVPSEKMAV